MLTVTLDTGLLLALIDGKPTAEHVKTILRWHVNGKIHACVSNRIFDPDTSRMRADQVTELSNILNSNGIPVIGSVARFGISRLDGLDLLSGGPTTRSREEMDEFSKIVGKDPSSLSSFCVGTRISNKIGDYDALRDHFASNRAIFITLDGKDYLHTDKRVTYWNQLHLKIMSPSEFVADHTFLDIQ